MFGTILENVRKKAPLIHNITNYVTVNDCANILLACGASPIMADDMEEAEEITSICGGLNINIGTCTEYNSFNVCRREKGKCPESSSCLTRRRWCIETAYQTAIAWLTK